MARIPFMTALNQRWRDAATLVCVGLDPDPSRFPERFGDTEEDVFTFCRDIADATASYACAFKPQIAHFAARGYESALERIINHIHDAHPNVPVILDAKRGDIGSTASHYVSEAFDRYNADAVTVNPFLGRDSVQPFLDRADRGVIILCRTSNPGGNEMQGLTTGGSEQALYLQLAERIASDWNEHGNCALVVGATWPDELAAVRSAVGDMPLLVPGVGAQGGDVAAVLRAGCTAAGTGLIINSSRGILYAGDGESFAQAAASAAKELRDTINALR